MTLNQAKRLWKRFNTSHRKMMKAKWELDTWLRNEDTKSVLNGVSNTSYDMHNAMTKLVAPKIGDLLLNEIEAYHE